MTLPEGYGVRVFKEHVSRGVVRRVHRPYQAYHVGRIGNTFYPGVAPCRVTHEEAVADAWTHLRTKVPA